MREIKFRAWDKTLKQMIPVYDIQFEDTEIYEIDGVGFVPKKKQPIIINTKTSWRTEDEIVLLQYTGLKDKNGKEIYEGDIFSLSIYTYNEKGKEEKIKGLWVLEWHKDGCFVLRHLHRKELEPVCISSLIYGIDMAEVIGNIYENPELLEENHESNKETD